MPAGADLARRAQPGMPPAAVWRQVRQGVAQNAIIVDGKVDLTGVPHPEGASPRSAPVSRRR